MCRIPLALPVALLMAADPAWRIKPIPQWNEEDARQVLADSPWAKTFNATLLPELTPEQRRAGGATGGGKGVGLKGLAGINLTGIGRQAERPAKSAGREMVMVRWESASPVRAAELKAHETGAPDLEGDDYAIAVYEVPGLKADQKSLPGELKKIAFLKRERKKDVKPSRVQIFPQAGELVIVVYLFPRSVEITKEDKRIGFVAQIGRLYVAQDFYPAEMHF